VPRKLFGRSLCLPIKLFGEERVDAKSDPFLMGSKWDTIYCLCL